MKTSFVLPAGQQLLVPWQHCDHYRRRQSKSACCGNEGSHPARWPQVGKIMVWGRKVAFICVTVI